VPKDVGIVIRSDMVADYDSVLRRVRVADAAGVHSVWVTESWGRDAFTLLSLLAANTEQIRLATGIVNVFSRTPSALAQHFATLDELSGGRAIVGLGVSGPRTILDFHGVPFDRPLARLRESVEIINRTLARSQEPYRGSIYRIDRPLPIQFEPVRDHIPVFIASMTPRSVRQTAQVADGWLPNWSPLSGLAEAISAYRAEARAAGRSATVRAPRPLVLTQDVEAGELANRRMLAFYVARMGGFFADNLIQLGHGELVAEIRHAFDTGGRDHAASVIPEAISRDISQVTNSIDAAHHRLEEQAKAGVDIHTVEINGYDDRATKGLLKELVEQ
jgi:alkanesulfonate monooxygenase SsuD/methylene tetrahydromethanopterin reductase-like flavin-dependent oxidoreductase (luciferase family)